MLDLLNRADALPRLRQVDCRIPGVSVLITDVVPETLLRGGRTTEELSFEPTFGHLVVNWDDASVQQLAHFGFVAGPTTEIGWSHRLVQLDRLGVIRQLGPARCVCLMG